MDTLKHVIRFNEICPEKLPLAFLTACIESLKHNDSAHNLTHVLNVCKTGSTIFRHYKDEYNLTERDELLIFVSCLMHDLGCRYNRKNHHLISYGLVYSYIDTFYRDGFTCEEINHIAQCVLEHRSSSTCKPTSILSEIVSVADSGSPNLNLYIERAILFRISTPEKYTKAEEIINETLEHILDKFGETGYHWKSYPEIGKKYYKRQWDEFKSGLTNKFDLLRNIERIYFRFLMPSR